MSIKKFEQLHKLLLKHTKQHRTTDVFSITLLSQDWNDLSYNPWLIIYLNCPSNHQCWKFFLFNSLSPYQIFTIRELLSAYANILRSHLSHDFMFYPHSSTTVAHKGKSSKQVVNKTIQLQSCWGGRVYECASITSLTCPSGEGQPSPVIGWRLEPRLICDLMKTNYLFSKKRHLATPNQSRSHSWGCHGETKVMQTCGQ